MKPRNDQPLAGGVDERVGRVPFLVRGGEQPNVDQVLDPRQSADESVREDRITQRAVRRRGEQCAHDAELLDGIEGAGTGVLGEPIDLIRRHVHCEVDSRHVEGRLELDPIAAMDAREGLVPVENAHARTFEQAAKEADNGLALGDLPPGIERAHPFLPSSDGSDAAPPRPEVNTARSYEVGRGRVPPACVPPVASRRMSTPRGERCRRPLVPALPASPRRVLVGNSRSSAAASSTIRDVR